MRTGIRWVLRIVFLLVLLVACGSFIPRPLIAPVKASSVAATHRILLLSGPIHTDIAIPLDEEARSAFSFLVDDGFPLGHPDAEWLIVGWGGRAFYLETPTWAELKPLPVLRALTIDRSVLHVDLAGHITEPQSSVAPFDVSDDQLARLRNFISDSFVRDAGSVVPIPDAGYGEIDRFFEAKGYFNALFGCNTWTAAALRSAGLRTGLWNAFPQSLRLSVAVYN
ncbi:MULTISPECIES: TIGR02117 family protein [unclassified Rhizobium]|uniref:TIGR02117 family protein n=1 Tax=unclassified Rhizobium TaxID=2613769 RepID=UPI001A99E060|nr:MULTISPECIES: TIGR02117 family protein [unclassified Rhizobium]MBX5160133.1 TIGR02117 family protein [Rhizobium sp. NZLR8]MBX5165590.1 TIGR02117 family protein [Rhizobium sp. NZLR4b]MBX5171859.1 TIGR02117 family protein [Rhizobium sp. NZLR1b]MBX5183255.1 TIGR02117 family protein [Rhizobium sp. NZLR5]MBX5193118.1 TIGR02117 family protein [Rhizobium sp. NZLR3b]